MCSIFVQSTTVATRDLCLLKYGQLTVTKENSMEGPQKSENRTTIQIQQFHF